MSSNRFDRFEYYECLRQQDTLLDEAIARRRLADCPHGPFEHRLGLDGYLYIGARVRRVREAVAESQSIALRELQAKLGGIGLADVWPILREICHDVALYVGGGAIVGGAIGGGLGVFAFAAGALPGAAAGAALGTQAGNLLLGFFGLKSVVVFMLDSLPRATRAYRQGFFEAWGGMPDLGAYSLDAPHYGVDRLADSTSLAARAFARGHEILILALLAGVVAYLTRGKGQLSALLAEVRESARLGPKMASWLEQNEGKLLNHPLLNERARGNGGGAIGGGPATGAAVPGPRTGIQATIGTTPRGATQAVGEAERTVLLRANNTAASKLSFDSSLNVVDRSFSVRAGEILADNPVGSASYARLQRQGTDVKFVNDPNMPAMGYFDAYDNSVTVNMLRHSSAEEAASTIVHEATHQNGFYNGVAQNTQFTEYQAFRNEALFMNGARPSLSERINIWNDVQSLYPDLPQGKYPFRGKR